MRVIAFYLPQFHCIPENDAWWGKGFTEWVNVARAARQYAEHDQPRSPGILGEYDLTDSSVHARQTRLAQGHGIDGFCMYFYWFDGRRLLDRPVEAWRADSSLLPYCLSWANEPWTRRWDGKNKDVLMPQSYPRGYVEDLFAQLLPHFQAPHYLRQDGKPLLVVHRADLVPHGTAFTEQLRLLARRAGLPDLYLIAAETTPDLDPRRIGFDAVAEFPPVGANRLRNAQWRPVGGLDRSFRGRLLSYDRIRAWFEGRTQPAFIRHRGVMPMWDNTARRGSRATVYVGHSPLAYNAWLRAAIRAEHNERGDRGLVFVNAWNEWAEGAYLEPDATHGDAYLLATAAARRDEPVRAHTAVVSGELSMAHLLSLGQLGAGSGLARWRTVRNSRGRWAG